MMTRRADHPYRVRIAGAPAVTFATLRGAATHAAIRTERDPRAARAVVEYRDPDGTGWHAITLELDASRIPTGSRPLTTSERRTLGLGPRRAAVPD